MPGEPVNCEPCARLSKASDNGMRRLVVVVETCAIPKGFCLQLRTTFAESEIDLWALRGHFVFDRRQTVNECVSAGFVLD